MKRYVVMAYAHQTGSIKSKCFHLKSPVRRFTALLRVVTVSRLGFWEGDTYYPPQAVAEVRLLDSEKGDIVSWRTRLGYATVHSSLLQSAVGIPNRRQQ